MFSRVLCPVDGSKASLEAARVALDLARKYNGELRLLQVIPVHLFDLLSNRVSMGEVDLLPREVENRLAAEARATLDHFRQELGVGEEVACLLVEGVPGEVICEQAEESDVVVMGSRGRGRLSGLLLGSVSQYVLSHSGKPVLIMPRPDHAPA